MPTHHTVFHLPTELSYKRAVRLSHVSRWPVQDKHHAVTPSTAGSALAGIIKREQMKPFLVRSGKSAQNFRNIQAFM
jgi:hypothetical protein